MKISSKSKKTIHTQNWQRKSQTMSYFDEYGILHYEIMSEKKWLSYNETPEEIEEYKSVLLAKRVLLREKRKENRKEKIKGVIACLI